jgi:exonuclease III
MKFFFQNVQSPPEARARQLLDLFAQESADVLVLSELSCGRGSKLLASGLASIGYQAYCSLPERGEYSALLAIRGTLRNRPLKWFAEYGTHRGQFALLRIEAYEFLIGGIYAPSLNFQNMAKRHAFFESMQMLLMQASKINRRCIVFGGDINEIPPWHIPHILDFEREGYPFHSSLDRLNLVDLAKSRLPPGSYTWYSRENQGQLLDAAYISASYEHYVKDYWIDDSLLRSKLSDHAGIRLQLSLKLGE